MLTADNSIFNVTQSVPSEHAPSEHAPEGSVSGDPAPSHPTNARSIDGESLQSEQLGSDLQSAPSEQMEGSSPSEKADRSTEKSDNISHVENENPPPQVSGYILLEDIVMQRAAA